METLFYVFLILMKWYLRYTSSPKTSELKSYIHLYRVRISHRKYGQFSSAK